MLKDKLASGLEAPSDFKLENGSRVAVMGSGPAGSFFSYFLLEFAQRLGIDVRVDTYDPRDFSLPGPTGCNMCGGIVSESMVQFLAVEGINLPPNVVQRGIDSYVLHMDEGKVRIDTPFYERRIAAVHRGHGPKDTVIRWDSFDRHLQELTARKGANVVRGRVEEVSLVDGRPQINIRGGSSQVYDLLAVAVGVNSGALKQFQNLGLGYQPPRITKTYVCEYHLGEETVNRYLGSSMHVFLLNIPQLEFAAIVPKGDCVTVCLLGKDIDRSLVQSFLESPEVRGCFPLDYPLEHPTCHCSPHINIEGAAAPFADRVVFIGDSGFTRLYKDGIGAAYRTAKAAATTAIFEGVSSEDFRKHYLPVCHAIDSDNKTGEIIFALTRQIQKMSFARRGVLRMVSEEQQKEGDHRRMSSVLWDLFTGSAPYKDVFRRTLNPAFLGRFFWDTVVGNAPFTSTRSKGPEEDGMETRDLGRIYPDGEIIVRQGETGDCMYVIQEGRTEVVEEQDGKEVRLAILGEGDFFGEMAIFEHEVRSATVRCLGEVRALTVDKRTFLRRTHEDPSLAFRIIQIMSSRIRQLDTELTRIKSGDSNRER